MRAALDRSKSRGKKKDEPQEEINRRQIMANEMFGGLFAEMEQLFAHCKVATWSFYRRFLMTEGQSIEEVMDNISGYMECLALIANICDSQGLQMYKFPFIPEHQIWEHTVENLPYKPETALAKNVLFNVMECLKWERIYKLPGYLTSYIERQPRLRIKADSNPHDANSNNQMMRMSTKAQVQAAESCRNIAWYLKTNPEIKFSQIPLLRNTSHITPTKPFEKILQRQNYN